MFVKIIIILLRAGTWFDFHIDDEKCVDDVEIFFIYEFGLTRYDSRYNTREFIWGRCLSSIFRLCVCVFVIIQEEIQSNFRSCKKKILNFKNNNEKKPEKNFNAKN